MSRTLANNLIPTLTLAEVADLWSLIAVGDCDECWRWLGPTLADINGGNSPYGYSIYGLAHRIVFFVNTGIQPGRLQVQHSCNNPICCNPTHLSLGTAKQNSEYMLACDRQNPKRGPKTAVTEDTRRLVRESTLNNTQMAKQTGLSIQTIRRIRK